MRLAATLFCLVLVALPLHAQVGKNQNIADPNLADRAAFRSLPHVTDALADAIIAARPFTSATALDSVVAKTLGAAERTELYARPARRSC
jgi:DNA uptake protein ComE-like DNA-binding protein